MVTATATNNRMAKPNKAHKKQPKRAAGKHDVFDSSPELRNTVAAIEKQFGEGAIMPLGTDTVHQIEGISTGSLSLEAFLCRRLAQEILDAGCHEVERFGQLTELIPRPNIDFVAEVTIANVFGPLAQSVNGAGDGARQ